MSSSADAGYYAEELRKASEKRCTSKKSPDGKHKPVPDIGTPPSQHFVCKYCKADLGYSK